MHIFSRREFRHYVSSRIYNFSNIPHITNIFKVSSYYRIHEAIYMQSLISRYQDILDIKFPFKGGKILWPALLVFFTVQLQKGWQISNYYAPCFYRLYFFAIPSYLELPWYKLSNYDNNKFILLLRKGIYPYEFMNGWENFKNYLYLKKNIFTVTYIWKMFLMQVTRTQKEIVKILK